MQIKNIKMYHDLREQYWWNELKSNIALFIYLASQQVKVEHQRPSGCCNPYQCQYGNGNLVQWILWCNCLKQETNIMLQDSLLTSYHLTFWPLKRPILLTDQLNVI